MRLTRRIGVQLPTRREDWRLMGRVTRLVLTIPGYAAIALVTAAVALTAFVVSLNVPLVADLVVGGTLPLDARLRVLLELYPFIGTAFGTVQGILLVIVAVITGIDLALVAYQFREHGVALREGGTASVGALLGALGAGCAACGSALLVGVLSLLGVQASLLFLPFEGLEFALAALVVLTLSVYWLARGLRGGMINGCPVDL